MSARGLLTLALLASAVADPAYDAEAALYARAVLDEHEGRTDRAFDAYHRIVVDAPTSAAAARARVGIARIELGRGHAGRAALWLDAAIERQVAPETLAVPLRDLAVRRLLSGARGAARVPTGLRGVVAMAPLATGDVLFATAREQAVVLLDGEGGSRERWEIAGLEAIAVDPAGDAYAADATSIVRLLPEGSVRRIAALGDYAPVEAMAIDGLGGIWLIDRHGDRIGRVAPGSEEPETFHEDPARKLVDLAWDGTRLVALDARTRAVVAFRPDGAPRLVATPELLRPLRIASDRVGRIAVLDARPGTVVLVPGDLGAAFTTLDLAAFEVEKPVALAFGFDGALQLFDAADGGWSRER